MDKIIIAGTGHRPNKLGGYGEDVKEALENLARDWLHAHKVDMVISGGALGWDQVLAWAAYHNKVPFTLALPFPEFYSKWPRQSQDELENLVSVADKVHYVCEAGYAPRKMQTRNEWMVDNCNLVLALWDGSKGGTGNCIAYANKVNKPIENLWSRYSV